MIYITVPSLSLSFFVVEDTTNLPPSPPPSPAAEHFKKEVALTFLFKLQTLYPAAPVGAVWRVTKYTHTRTRTRTRTHTHTHTQ